MRGALVRLHRWFGLLVAVFLFISGLTGAIISWDHELDEWLNPALYRSNSGPESIAKFTPLELAAKLEQADPRVRVTYLPLAIEPGHALVMFVSPRVNAATGKLHEVSYNQVAMDPTTAEVQAQRYWGAVSLTRENLLPFLYKLHYSMHIPDVSGIEIGVLFMGIVGIVWVIDCFIALYLSFPTLAAWRKSFAFRWRQGGYKLNFDLHRSGGMWVWLILLMVAMTSISMNLDTQVMRPVVSLFSTLSPSPFAVRAPIAEERAPEPRVSLQSTIDKASRIAAERNLHAPAGAIFYSPAYQAIGVGFFEAGNDHGDGGLGNPWLYFDSQDGHLAFEEIPGTGTAGDIFMQAQFPLHSGRIIGLPGRIAMSVMGLVVAMLSVTGIVIWARKLRARLARGSEAQARIDSQITNRKPILSSSNSTS
jgi:uncharacterized iron-regulated membrane protein